MLQAGDPLSEGAREGAQGEDERLAVFGAAVAEIAGRVEPAYRYADGWLEQTRAGLVELLRFCDERPETARELVVESIAWGPGVLRRRGRLLDTLAAALDRGRAEAELPDLDASSADPGPGATVAGGEDRHVAMPPGTAENLVGACVSLVHTRLLGDDDGSFLELAPSLMSMIVHPYLGPQAAKHELGRALVNAAAGPAERDSDRPVARVHGRDY
jgi:hypothetical protein